VSRPRLTIRARLTLLYTGLFAVCGAIVVAVSYTLMARLAVTAQGQGNAQQPLTGGDAPASIAAQCQSQQTGAYIDKRVLAQCASYLEQQAAHLQQQAALQAAQHQRDLTLSHLLQYSLITLAVVIALACRNLSDKYRNRAIFLGSAGAIVLRRIRPLRNGSGRRLNNRGLCSTIHISSRRAALAKLFVLWPGYLENHAAIDSHLWLAVGH